MDQSELLKNIDQNIGTILGSQKDARKRIEEIEKEQGAILARIKATDERLESREDTLTRIESEFNKRRFDTGSGPLREIDALRNALPDDLKAFIPQVETLKGGGIFSDGSGNFYRRSGLAATMAQTDPVKYVAIGGWFHARIMAFNCARKGESTKAQMWTERAEKIADALGGVSKAALQEDTNAEGGFLIPTVTEAMIGWLMKEASVVRAAGATVLQMTTKSHQLPTLANDFTVNWTAEEGSITDAAPGVPFGSGNLTAKKQTGLVTLAIELVQDNVVNLMDFVMTHLIQQLGRAEDTQALEGDGTVFTGLFSASGVNSVDGGSNALTEDELRKLIFGGEHQATLENGVIFCHPWIVRDALGLTTGSAGSIWYQAIFGNPSSPKDAMPWRVPTYKTSVISRTRSTDKTTAYHGDPSYIVIGDRAGSVFDVNPYSETEYKKGQILLRVIRRVGILVWVPAYFTKLINVQVTA